MMKTVVLWYFRDPINRHDIWFIFLLFFFLLYKKMLLLLQSFFQCVRVNNALCMEGKLRFCENWNKFFFLSRWFALKFYIYFVFASSLLLLHRRVVLSDSFPLSSWLGYNSAAWPPSCNEMTKRRSHSIHK